MPAYTFFRKSLQYSTREHIDAYLLIRVKFPSSQYDVTHKEVIIPLCDRTVCAELIKHDTRVKNIKTQAMPVWLLHIFPRFVI